MVAKKNYKKKSFTQQQFLENQKGRVYFLVFAVAIMGGLIFLRLFNLQVLAHSFYQEVANNQHRLQKKLFPERGKIFMKEKDSLFPVAVNQELMTVYAVSQEIEDPEKTSYKLADILEIDLGELLNKLNKKSNRFQIIKRRITAEEEKKVRDLNLKGIYMESESWRYYPGGDLAAQLIGFVGYAGNERLGRYGIERQFEQELRGKNGFVDQEKDIFGNWIPVGKRFLLPKQDGSDLVLTIDHIIQYKAELALHNAIKKHKADGGKIVIMDPKEGKILAMANYPSFDLNRFSEVEDMGIFINQIVTDAYECGSVFKPITMAAGLDAGLVEPDTTYVDKGSVLEAGYIIKNSDEKSHGEQTMTQVIEKSLNTGVIFVQEKIGKERFLRYIKQFGFGEKTGIELPNESIGNITNLYTDRKIEFYTASFGQGITVTPLQLAVAYSAIANGGELLQPQIIDKVIRKKGEGEEEEIQVSQREVKRKVISQQSAQKLALMLQSNVENGHGKLAGVPGYFIAGKTGTAQVADKEKGGYLKDITVGTFAGFGPVEDPVFTMVVVINNPKDVIWAESSAAPVFGELAQFILDYFEIEPTREFSAQDLANFAQKHNYLTIEEEDNKESEDKNNKEKEEENNSKKDDKVVEERN